MWKLLFSLGAVASVLHVSAAPAVEFTKVLTPQLAGVEGVRLFVRPDSDGACQVPDDAMTSVVKRTLTTAGIETVDGFDPARPDWPILEVELHVFDFGDTCDVSAQITLRANVTGAEVEGHHYYEYEVIWGDAGALRPEFHPAAAVVEHASAVVEERLRTMTKAIKDARRLFPEF